MNQLTRGLAKVGALIVGGMTGAKTAFRLVGSNATGSPSTGTFKLGDVAISQDGNVYVCTVAGTPGTWVAGTNGPSGSVTTLAVSGASTLGGPLVLTPPTALTYTASGTTSIDPTTGSVFTVTTATGNSSFALASSPPAGQIITILIANDSGGARTITFTTHFKAAATLVGTASKSCTITFVSDGTNAYEVSRSGGATATGGL